MRTHTYAAMVALLGGTCLLAQPVPPAEQPTNRPSREQLRQELRQLTPEERQARIREIRERMGPAGPWREEAERRREEWKDLPPEERRAKMLEWRNKRMNEQRDQQAVVNPEERDLHRQQIRGRLDKQIQELTTKKSQGTLTPEEQRRLAQLEQVSKYFTQQPPAPPVNR